MAEAEVDRPSTPPATGQVRARPRWVRGMACLAMIPLIGFIGQSSHSLWGEWSSLRVDRASERESAIVGYLNINPDPNYATTPADWLHDEGDESLLWAGWKKGEHRWFRFGRGEVEGWALSRPIGRDTIQAIDHPIYEQDGGPRWSRVPHEARVFGFGGDGPATAYPLKVLDKVEVINDRMGDRPVLIAYTPVVETVSIFEADLDGRRVSMGHGGYFQGFRPVLYDRGTETLWSETDGAMVAVAGRRKGASLKRIARLNLVAWGDWRASHPDGRLLVGADRSRAVPVD